MKQAILTGTHQRFTISKILCIGQNYARHAKEMNFEVPKSPVFFLKPTTAIIYNGDKIILPAISNDVHHEIEMTVLIGKGGKNIPRDSALNHVAGYGVGLDMTMRDIQAEAKKQGLPWTLAKGFDTSAPLSEFVPAQQVQDPGTLNIELKVNGEIRQSSNTDNLIFPIDVLVSYISQFITFESGDIMYTGTPEGVSRITHNDKLEAKLSKSDGTNLASLRVEVQ